VDLLSSRLLHRTGTIAALTTAAVLGGSGLALAATTHDVPGPVAPSATAPVVGPVAVHVPKFLPAPRPQSAPLPTSQLTHVVTSVVQGVTKAVTGTPEAPPPTKPTQPPATAPKAHPVARTAPHATARTSSVHRVSSRARVQDSDSAISPAHDAAFVQRTDPAVTPHVAPVAAGPLAGLPDDARHALPTVLVVMAAAILAALAAGHLGLWRARRRQLT
jgi:hypothetical protein